MIHIKKINFFFFLEMAGSYNSWVNSNCRGSGLKEGCRQSFTCSAQSSRSLFILSSVEEFQVAGHKASAGPCPGGSEGRGTSWGCSKVPEEQRSHLSECQTWRTRVLRLRLAMLGPAPLSSDSQTSIGVAKAER